MTEQKAERGEALKGHGPARQDTTGNRKEKQGERREPSLKTSNFTRWHVHARTFSPPPPTPPHVCMHIK